jgi:hypothetical protein
MGELRGSLNADQVAVSSRMIPRRAPGQTYQAFAEAQWVSGEAEFAIVVIFNDRRAIPLRPFQESETSRE